VRAEVVAAQAPPPRLEVDVGRRGRRDDVAGGDAHAADVAHVRVSGSGVEVDDVMAGVPGRVRHLHAVDRLAALERHDVLLRDGQDLAPQVVHRIAIEAAGAREEPGGVDEVARATFVHVDLERREPAHECAGGAGVVEMDVCEQEGLGLVGLHPLEQGLDAALGTRIDDRPADLPGADDVLDAPMANVDQAGHGPPGGSLQPLKEFPEASR
jgi:hypothetical protein